MTGNDEIDYEARAFVARAVDRMDQIEMGSGTLAQDT